MTFNKKSSQGAAKQAIYDEIPDVHVFLNLIEAVVDALQQKSVTKQKMQGNRMIVMIHIYI